MIPEHVSIATFWDGTLDRLRQLCLTSQAAAGHRVTVYSFEAIKNLPRGVSNGDAATIMPRAFAEKLRPVGADAQWSGLTRIQFSDFFRMRLLSERKGIWVDADVLLLKPLKYDPARPYFGWENWYQIGNSVLYLPADDPIVAAFGALIEQQELTPAWLSLKHRVTLSMHKMTGKSSRLSDMRVSIFGPPALTTLARRNGSLRHAVPKKTFYSVHAKPEKFFEPADFSRLIEDPEILGFHISPKSLGNTLPIPGSLYAWAAEKFG